MNEQNVTHIVLPVELYRQLGGFLTSLPYSQVAKVISTIEQHAQAVFHAEADEHFAERYLPVGDGSEGE